VRLTATLGLFLGLLLTTACGGDESISRELYELERLAFVPAARFKLVEYTNDPNADCSMKQSIVMDRFEFTLRDLLHYQDAIEDQEIAAKLEARGGEAELSEAPLGFADGLLDRPVHLNYYEASELAGLRGMRIPRAKEWIHVAVGRKRLRFPWGSRLARFANTKEIDLGRPVRVGTFENGRVEPFGCYDMLGNVWEWVADEAPSFFPQFEVLEGDITSVMGGAFDSSLDWLYNSIDRSLCFHARTVRKDRLDPAYGARMCADAEAYLFEKAPLWGTGPEARSRVTAVARRWAEDFVARDVLQSILEELVEKPSAPEALLWLQKGLAEAPER